VWWDILLSLYYKFTVKSVDERILKFGTDKKMFIMVTLKKLKESPTVRNCSSEEE